MTTLQAKIIVLLAENNLNISAVCRAIYMHRTSLYYHVRKIEKRTGKNPTVFYDLIELLPVARQVLGYGNR